MNLKIGQDREGPQLPVIPGVTGTAPLALGEPHKLGFGSLPFGLQPGVSPQRGPWRLWPRAPGREAGLLTAAVCWGRRLPPGASFSLKVLGLQRDSSGALRGSRPGSCGSGVPCSPQLPSFHPSGGSVLGLASTQVLRDQLPFCLTVIRTEFLRFPNSFPSSLSREHLLLRP